VPQRQRRTEFAQTPGASAYPSRSHKPLEPFPVWYGNKQRHWAAAIRDFKRLAGRDALKPAARLLTKFTNSNLNHVLHSSTGVGATQYAHLIGRYRARTSNPS
jgi:hypothetical protein